MQTLFKLPPTAAQPMLKTKHGVKKGINGKFTTTEKHNALMLERYKSANQYYLSQIAGLAIQIRQKDEEIKRLKSKLNETT